MSDRGERWLAANGLRFRALEWGGAAPTALLVHATSFCADGWRPLWSAARANGADLRAVAIDQRGHGRSDAPAAPHAYEWTRLADDAAALAALLAAEDEQRGAGHPARVVGIGHSSGATSLLAAAGAHPERFAAIVAVEPVLFEAGSDGAAAGFAGDRFLAAAARRRRDRFASRSEARERLAAKPPLAGFDRAALDAVLDGALAEREDGSVSLRCPGEREAACYEGAAALDLWPLAARIEAPLLLVLGERGAVAPTLRKRLAAAARRTCVEVVPGATHFAALERPGEVGAAIARFLASLARG
jgi:pimeloyl-ACP methyl ester carboxylesterase